MLLDATDASLSRSSFAIGWAIVMRVKAVTSAPQEKWHQQLLKASFRSAQKQPAGVNGAVWQIYSVHAKQLPCFATTPVTLSMNTWATYIELAIAREAVCVFERKHTARQ